MRVVAGGGELREWREGPKEEAATAESVYLNKRWSGSKVEHSEMLVKQKGKCDDIIIPEAPPQSGVIRTMTIRSRAKEGLRAAHGACPPHTGPNLVETILWELSAGTTEQQQKAPCNTAGNEYWSSLDIPSRDLAGNAVPRLSAPIGRLPRLAESSCCLARRGGVQLESAREAVQSASWVTRTTHLEGRHTIVGRAGAMGKISGAAKLECQQRRVIVTYRSIFQVSESFTRQLSQGPRCCGDKEERGCTVHGRWSWTPEAERPRHLSLRFSESQVTEYNTQALAARVAALGALTWPCSSARVPALEA